MIHKFSWLLVFILVVFSVLPYAADAQEEGSVGITVSPALIEENINPGSTFSSVLRVTNLNSKAETYYIVKRNIKDVSISGSPIFAEEGEETGYEVSSWINITSEPIVIPAGQTREVPFSIEVPENATPGGHFGGLFVSFTPPQLGELGSGVGYQVGTLLSLRISGEIFEEMRIREFRTDKTIYSKPKVTFITRVENLGNALLRPRGPLEITDFFGKQVATITVNDSGAGVFPYRIREFETTWQGEGFVFGRYQVLMGLVYGQDGRKSITRTTSFWVLPLNIILPVGGSLIGLILVAFILIKLYIRKKLRDIRQATKATRAGRFKTVEQELAHYKEAPFSRFVFIALGVLMFSILFLGVLFFFFA